MFLNIDNFRKLEILTKEFNIKFDILEEYNLEFRNVEIDSILIKKSYNFNEIGDCTVARVIEHLESSVRKHKNCKRPIKLIKRAKELNLNLNKELEE